MVVSEILGPQPDSAAEKSRGQLCGVVRRALPGRKENQYRERGKGPQGKLGELQRAEMMPGYSSFGRIESTTLSDDVPASG